MIEVGNWGQLIHAEALETLRLLPENCIDSLLCDPPAGIAFMPQTNRWDSDRGGRQSWVAWLAEIMREAHRVMKPGAHGFVWSHSTTSHWTGWALEDAGFEVRECFYMLHAQGGSKCLNLAKALDKLAGAEPAVIGPKPWKNQDIRSGRLVGGGEHEQLMETEPVTEEAQKWNGWYSGVKPTVECWWLVRKKPSEPNLAKNLLKWGVGALNIDATRVHRASSDVPGWHKSGSYGRDGFQGTSTFAIRDMTPEEVQTRCGSKGRFTPNCGIVHAPECVLIGSHKVKGCPAEVIQGGKDGGGYDVGSSDGTRRGVFKGYGDAEGMEEVDLWACVPHCPARLLDGTTGRSRSRKGKPRKSKQPGDGWGMTHTGAEYDDEGGVSRYYPHFQSDPTDEIEGLTWAYIPKASRAEKEAGLDHLEAATLNRVNPGGMERDPKWGPKKVKNTHATVKSLAVCRWLARLITPPNGLLLDCFLGSGSTGCAAALEGFRFIGIEQGNPPGCDRYLRIAEGRMRYWAREAGRGD